MARIQPQANHVQQDCQSKGNPKANFASQTQPTATGLCEHRPLEDTSVSTAYTNSPNTSELQVKHHHHRRMQQQAQQQKARDRAHHKQVISRQSKRRQQNLHHQWLHHQRIRSDQHCQHHRLHRSPEKQMTQ